MSALEKFTHFTHELERSKDNKEVYRCVHPRCRFYQRRAYLIGKESVCTKCKNHFILTLAQLRNKRPVCEFCSKSPKAEALRQARDLALKAAAEMIDGDLPDEVKQALIDNTLE